jgi:hypothetical protein
VFVNWRVKDEKSERPLFYRTRCRKNLGFMPSFSLKKGKKGNPDGIKRPHIKEITAMQQIPGLEAPTPN